MPCRNGVPTDAPFPLIPAPKPTDPTGGGRPPNGMEVRLIGALLGQFPPGAEGAFRLHGVADIGDERD